MVTTDQERIDFGHTLGLYLYDFLIAVRAGDRAQAGKVASAATTSVLKHLKPNG